MSGNHDIVTMTGNFKRENTFKPIFAVF